MQKVNFAYVLRYIYLYSDLSHCASVLSLRIAYLWEKIGDD